MLGLLGIIGGATESCKRQASTPGVFQYQFALCVDRPKDEYWSQVEKGLVRALAKFNAKVEPFYPPNPSSEPPYPLLKAAAPELHGCALAPSKNRSVDELVLQLIERGVPVICIGSDAPRSARLVLVTTDYYQIGRKLGFFFAKRLQGGNVLLLGSHPVAGAWEEFVRGFRYGLGMNRRLNLRLIQGSTPEEAERRLSVARRDPQLRGVALVGSEVLNRGIQTLKPSDKGAQVLIAGFSYKAQDDQLVHSHACAYLLQEQPEELGYRAGNILWNLGQGRSPTTSHLLIDFKVVK